MHLYYLFFSGLSRPSPTYLCFFSGKIPAHVAARSTRKYWVPNFRHFVTSPPPPPPPLFATICYYSSLFVTICHYLRLFAAIRTIRYSRLFATIRYSLFGFSRHPSYAELSTLNQTEICQGQDSIRHAMPKVIQSFQDKITHGPEYISTCCDQLWFRSSVSKCNSIKYSDKYPQGL